MVYPIKIRDDLENLNELVSLQNQVEELRLQASLGEHNFHENMKTLLEPVTDTIKNTSEDARKTITETSFKNNKELTNLNNKLLEILNDRGIIATYCLFYLKSPKLNILVNLN